MEYRRFNDTVVLRLDPGDEILESLLKVAEIEKINLAEVNGLGATNKFTIGRYDLDKHEYEKYSFVGSYEISSLHGNITIFNNTPYLHLHMVAGTTNGNTVSGHLNEAYISVTSEIFIRIIDGNVNRTKNKETFINTMSFNDEISTKEYTIKNEDLIAKFSSLGGEMISVKYKGKERMWQNDNNTWPGHAPVLFPIAGLIDVTIDGVNYPFNRHGFARKEEFKLEYQKEDSIKFSLESNDILIKQFPYEFKLTIEYKIIDNKIEETYEIINTGKDDFYGSIGGHTSFKLNDDISNYKLILEKDKEIDNCIAENNVLIKKEKLTSDGVIDLASHYLDNSETIIMDSIKSKKAQLVKKTGEKVADVEFYNFPHLLLWHPENSKMICIEPWHNLLDLKGLEKIDFRTKYTIIKIPVGEKEELKQVFTYYDSL